MIKKVCIIGYGFVGMAQMALLKTIAGGHEQLEVEVIDPAKGFPLEGREDVLRHADMVVVCVPTPEMDDGQVDVTTVADVVDQVTQYNETALIVVRSTITPGSTDRIADATGTRKRLHFMPEFIVERTGEDDDSRIIVGGPRAEDVVDAYLPRVAARLSARRATDPFVQGCYVHTCPSPLLPELIKYRTNAFLAMKVAFAVEMEQVSLRLGLDNEHVVDVWEMDSRVGTTHNRVILDNEGRAGFGGKCLPKDTAAIVHWMQEQGLDTPLLDAVSVYRQSEQ